MKRLIRACAMILVCLMLSGAYAETADRTQEASYQLILCFIDQGDAKSAVRALLDADPSDGIYEKLNGEHPELLERIIVEEACFCHEEGRLFDVVDLRYRGYLTDEMFLRYWERIGAEIPETVDKEETCGYDAYLLYELVNWYERGGEATMDIVDLRWLGMIEDALYIELVKELQVDLMDDVDPRTYVPLYGMRLTEDEKNQLRIWQAYVDEGLSREAADLVTSDGFTENAYRWLCRSNEVLLDLIHAQVMFENASADKHEDNVDMILGGFVSDACFERYWSLLEFQPAGDKRVCEDYPDVDMYFVYEIERICKMKGNDPSLLQWIWNENLIDVQTFDLLANRVGGWESRID